MATLNSQSLKYYHYILTEHLAGKNALSYLTQKRKLNKGIIDTFELGFSPNTGSSLSDYLVKKKGYKNKDLLLEFLNINVWITHLHLAIGVLTLAVYYATKNQE